MNREIKFRAWLTENKKWYDLDITDSASVGVLNVNFKYELIQSTGFKDKKKKEIWEEDIVSFMYEETFRTKRHIGYIAFDDQNGFWCICVLDEGVDIMLSDSNITELKLLGNTFENGELLNLKND